MAVDDQFSLSWNTFNSNLSAGFHESLCHEELIDVTLAAEGRLVKAHRLVLSVCSPYFRNMFMQIPSNQQAFVFLKDISHTVLEDLIQFMYCGEVNVKKEALVAFISAAEALQIKGLTEQNDIPSTPTSTKPCMPDPEICPIQQRRERRSSSLKLGTCNIKTYNSNENEQSSEFLLPTTIKAVTLKSEPFSKPKGQFEQINDKVAKTSGPNKRPANQNNDSMFLIKRTRNAIGAMASGTKAELDIKCNSEILDSPIKSELIFIDETVQETFYDNIISPENASNKIGTNVKNTINNSIKHSFDSIAKQDNISNNSNMKVLSQENCCQVIYTTSRRGTQLVMHNDNTYTPNEKARPGQKSRDWKCSMYYKAKCPARLVTMMSSSGEQIRVTCDIHTHSPMLQKIKY